MCAGETNCQCALMRFRKAARQSLTTGQRGKMVDLPSQVLNTFNREILYIGVLYHEVVIDSLAQC
jgi:hypothetical protein